MKTRKPIISGRAAGHRRPATGAASEERALDGKPYYEWSKTGFIGEQNHAEVVELTRLGIRRTFSLPSLWALARIR